MKTTSVTPQEAKKLLDEGRVTFVDSRNATAWGDSQQKLPGAVRVPADEVEQHLSELPEGNAIVAYCT